MPAHHRVSAQDYALLRDWMLSNDADAPRMLQWSMQGRGVPETPEKLAGEIVWIILCAGRSAQSARTIETKVWAAIRKGQPVVEVFGYRAKAQAIESVWAERVRHFDALRRIDRDVACLVQWCDDLPFIGDDTRYQLAKNLGADLCKPDIWLCRLSGIADQPRVRIDQRFARCMALCQYLADASQDSISTVDSMLWLACNKGYLRVSAQAGPIALNLQATTAKAIT